MQPMPDQSALNGSARQRHGNRQHYWSGLVSAALTFLLGVSVAGLAPASLTVAAQELSSAPDVITEPRSGRAIFGYDPVAYFVDDEARAGKAEHVMRWGGADWNFASAANLEHFRQDPGLYAPMLCGHDPARIISLHPVTADPRIFMIKGGRLWLFRSMQSREAFAADPTMATSAIAAWSSQSSGERAGCSVKTP